MTAEPPQESAPPNQKNVCLHTHRYDANPHICADCNSIELMPGVWA